MLEVKKLTEEQRKVLGGDGVVYFEVVEVVERRIWRVGLED